MRLCYALLSKLTNPYFSLNDTTFYALLHSYILIKSHNPGAQFHPKGDLHSCFLCPLFLNGERSIIDSCAQFPLKLLSTEPSGKKKEEQQKKCFVRLWGKGYCKRTKEDRKLEDEGKWKKIMRELQLKIKCNIVSDCKNRGTEV